MQNDNTLTIDLSTANPKQILFFKSRKRFVAYGGARGGGKSWAVQRKAVLMALHYSGIRILLLRRTYAELQENHISELRKMLNGFAKYTDIRKIFTFPNGSVIKLGYCANEGDTLQFQGMQYDIIFIDEATQFTYKMYSDLTACVRGANDFPKRMYLTCNPGGVGHEWVKRLFVSRKYEKTEKPEEYEFIPATVFDNKVLLDNDPGYVDTLNNLPDDIRAAWRDGDWNLLAGVYFEEFRRSIHIVEPFKIPDHWKKYRGIDYGLDGAACVWVAIDEEGNHYVYREFLKENLPIADAAAEILSMTDDNEKIEYTAAPPDLWGRSQESGKTKADLFRENGLNLIKSSNNREAGWLSIKELLKVKECGEEKYSRLKIFSSCETLIEHLTGLQRDAKRLTDCCREPHEITHLPDALRYIAIMFISASKTPKPQETELARIKRQAIRGNNRARSYW